MDTDSEMPCPSTKHRSVCFHLVCALDVTLLFRFDGNSGVLASGRVSHVPRHGRVYLLPLRVAGHGWLR